jgi:hypothetical protein
MGIVVFDPIEHYRPVEGGLIAEVDVLVLSRQFEQALPH